MAQLSYRIYDLDKRELYESIYEGYLLAPSFDATKGEVNNLMEGLEFSENRKGGYTEVRYFGTGYASIPEDLVREEFLMTIEVFEDMGYRVESLG